MAHQTPISALGLLSGGLDSMLAARLLMDQGIHVACVNFHTGFCIQGHTSAMRNPEPNAKPPRHDALHAAQLLGIKLHMVDIAEDYVRIVTDPKHGYGSNLNPCLDCKIFMVRKAWQLKEALGFHFLFTGEVIGQRPMSQRRENLPHIERAAGVEGWLLRPLCAQRLKSTEPEKLGWVDRKQLKGFHGRGRRAQMELAQQMGLLDYPSPAGGCCFLTDANYSRKLQDLWHSRGERQYTMDDILLLKAGRHLRPAPHFKVIVGRDETENNFLSGFRAQRWLLQAEGIPGPVMLVEGTPSDSDLTLACRLTARFGQGRHSPQVTIRIAHQGQEALRQVAPLPAEEIPESWYI
ncbi:MAG: tRNA (5-methylaminomethyl-2-thiouridylate)-methyltransferase [Magnetococcales bacterium]|nr:tRNA (5-methylaminomethyl-2-thiouridylate)-methyltransferase [Magnetococcales bacterium]MBF0114947.1 tRNA (5-methylaminomethyl-2-thiouridylate)-methyltransferase [Magnetococcales bacterium]